MERHSDLAIVLRVIPYQERSKVVTALTEKQGKVTVMASNAVQSKRFGAALEIFTAGDWIMIERPGSEMMRLESAHTRRAFETLRRDYDRLMLASLFVELTLRVAPEREPVPELFRLLANGLDAIDRSEETQHFDSYKMMSAFVVKLLQSLGVQPQLQSCLKCETGLHLVKGDVVATASQAGWFCIHCADGTSERYRIPVATLGDWVEFSAQSIRQAPSLGLGLPHEHRQGFEFLNALMQFHIPGIAERPLKTLQGFWRATTPPPRTVSLQ